MGRPLKNIDAKRVIELAAKGHLLKEIAALEGVTYDTLRRRFHRECEIGQDLLRGQLRAKQVEVALGNQESKPNPIMLIWLGKQLLDQVDKREDTLDIKRTTTIRMVGIAPQELEALAGTSRPQIEYSDAEVIEQEEPAESQ